MKIKMIAAHDINLGIGYRNKLLCSVPEDMKHFINHTKGKIVVMGRNTLQSIGKPLSGRVNAVLSKSGYIGNIFNDNGISFGIPFDWMNKEKYNKGFYKNKIFTSVDDLIDYYKDEEEIIVIGGESIYREFLDKADELIITVFMEMFRADSYFPYYCDKFKEVDRSELMTSSSGVDYLFVKFEKNK